MSMKGKTGADHHRRPYQALRESGMKSLEVKRRLAPEKISGALGIKVQSDIVLESSSRISLKVGGSFVVIPGWRGYCGTENQSQQRRESG